MKNKKSQVTIFIILGILIVIISGFVIFSSRYTQQKKSETEIRRSRQASFDLSPIETHITGCIKKTTEDALTLLVNQAGYIFASQGGSVMDFSNSLEGIFFVKDGDDTIPYAIYPPQTRDPGSDIWPDPPYYPSFCYPYPLDTPCNTSQEPAELPEAHFGENRLQPLTDEEHSMHSQITNYIENNIMNCIDFSIFEMQGFEVQAGTMNVDVTLARQAVTVHLDWPLEITKVVTEETTDLKDFYSNVNVRMFKLHNFVNNLIEKDITDLTFFIDNMQNDQDGFTVSRQESVNENNDDIIIVSDTMSRVKGQELKFRFARHNRPPVLYYIHRCPAECTFIAGQTIDETNLPDLSDPEVDALDPDEDPVTITVGEVYNLPDNPKDYVVVRASDEKLEDFQERIEVTIQ
jgi:hypothetical protein